MPETTTGPTALILAHGSPSAPEGPEAVMAALARSVAARLPGWRVAGATLAAEGAVARAVAALGGPPTFVYPHFMADGWFVGVAVPRRLAEAGVPAPRILSPFGLDPAVASLCLRRLRDHAAEAGVAPEALGVLLAAHGSPSDPRPAASARAAAARIVAEGGFTRLTVGFVDEPPYLVEAARMEGPAVCLPFFIGRAGHVETDLPEALAEARFPGPTLEPIGADPEAAAIIAAALSAA